jgi:hypothetical protein
MQKSFVCGLQAEERTYFPTITAEDAAKIIRLVRHAVQSMARGGAMRDHPTNCR